jgi:putative transposase
MSRKKGQSFSAEQKTKIVLELIKEESTLSQLATKYQITTKTILSWKKQFLENASLAFDVGGATKAYREEIEELKVENDRLAKSLGKATIRADWAEGKLKSLDLNSKIALIESEHQDIAVSEQCEIVGLNRSSYYYKPKPLCSDDIELMHRIDEIYTDNPDYGYRFIHQQLVEDGFMVGKDRVLRFMNVMGIRAISPQTKKLTSIKAYEHKIYPYLLKEYKVYKDKKSQVVVDKPNEVWSGDITYIRVNSGFMYLCAIIDWHSKAILSYQLSNTMDTALVTNTLKEALAKYPKPKIFNSDQGSQYTSLEHTQILKDNGIQISMNGKGRSIDNIAIERFFRTLKHSNIYISDYQDIKELKKGVKEYIYKYNFKRFHSAIQYQKPMNVYLNEIQNVA